MSDRTHSLRLWMTLGLLCALGVGPLRAQERGERYALIISGIAGDEAHYKRFWTAASYLVTCLTEAYGYDPANVWLLFEDAGATEGVVRCDSRLEHIVAAFEALKAKLTRRDTLFVVLIGHCDFDGHNAKFNIKGRDLTDAKLGKLLDALPPCRTCVAVTTANSGYFIRHLSKANRIVITATKPGREQSETVFPYKFIRAFSDRAADVNKDGRLTVAEAFTYAKAKVKAFYKERGLICTEHAMLDDNGDGMGSRELEDDGADGKLARQFAFEVSMEF